MKVDPNQNYQSHQVRRIDHSDENGFAVERVDTVGGIPLRLELAARFMAAFLFKEPAGRRLTTDIAVDALEKADILISIHDATCEVKNGE